MTEQELYDALWAKKLKQEIYVGFAETTKDLSAVRRVRDGNTLKTKEEKYTIPAGTTVRINMVSRFGDFGATEQLDIENGYNVRGFKPGDGVLTLCRLTRPRP